MTASGVKESLFFLQIFCFPPFFLHWFYQFLCNTNTQIYSLYIFFLMYNEFIIGEYINLLSKITGINEQCHWQPAISRISINFNLPWFMFVLFVVQFYQLELFLTTWWLVPLKYSLRTYDAKLGSLFFICSQTYIIKTVH